MYKVQYSLRLIISKKNFKIFIQFDCHDKMIIIYFNFCLDISTINQQQLAIGRIVFGTVRHEYNFVLHFIL